MRGIARFLGFVFATGAIVFVVAAAAGRRAPVARLEVRVGFIVSPQSRPTWTRGRRSTAAIS